MTKNKFARRFVVFAVFSIVPIWSLTAASAENSERADSAPYDLTGKIMVLLVDRSNALEQKNDSEVIENGKIQTIGGRIFVTGTAYSNPGDEHDWRKGAEVGVAWEEVTSFYLYSREQFQNYVKASENE